MTLRALLLCVALPGCVPPATSSDTSSAGVTSAGSAIVGLAGKCLDDYEDETTDGNKVQLYACNGSAAQEWMYANDTIVGPGGKCLDIKAGDQVAGTPVQLYPCNGTDAQKWTVKGSAIESTSGLCLDVTGGSSSNGTPVELNKCDGAASQAWKIGATTTGNTKSIKEWTTCDGKTDDFAGATKAFAAAKGNAFTLVVDCPVKISGGTGGMDIRRTIFIDNDTTVQFTSAGKFYVDNLFVPAFAIVDSTNVKLLDWEVEWDNTTPIDPATGGYYDNGKFVPKSGDTPPAGNWNDFTITQWMAANRGIKFSGATSIWGGGILPMAVFYLTGSTTNVTIDGLYLHPAANATIQQFVPMGISMSKNWKPNQTVTGSTAVSGTYAAIPHGITFSNIKLDGTYMGWLGSLESSTFENITSLRYGDLQDSKFGNLGGLKKWFAPPHLFYLNFITTGDSAFFNNNITMKDIDDEGERVGLARDTGSNGTSGYALSLKLGCFNCTVTDYTSKRPDGFMDVLPSSNLTMSDVTVSYDSAFIHNLYPGWRWPLGPYTNLTYSHLNMTDTASTAASRPMGPANSATDNTNIVFTDVNFIVNAYSGEGTMMPTVVNQGTGSYMTGSMKNTGEKIIQASTGNVTTTLSADAIVKAGSTTTLSWSSRGATSCVASGRWSGTVGESGSHTETPAKGTDDYVLTCKSGSTSAAATLPIVAD